MVQIAVNPASASAAASTCDREAVFLGDDGCLDRNLLGIGALLADVADGEDFVADTQVSDISAKRRNDAGEIPSKNVGELRKLVRFALTHLPVRTIDAGGDNIDQNLAGGGHGIRHLAEFQNFRSAVSFDEGGFHGHSFLRFALADPRSHF